MFKICCYKAGLLIIKTKWFFLNEKWMATKFKRRGWDIETGPNWVGYDKVQYQ